ncbi:DUF4834 family protein [Acetobacteroides hydrogenigenes]|uniref:Uncharacterized protein DUF4834 n=1 Tax=Acetobacteroides hydrogenigenes TaxID=979970 RepID=A0A4R2E421_9BACT|nr:DUF4834 family protein [Acetobacteroides hydrogenigenes]TCN62097.1 uncharacterized protein DUF4834 [Acetobacteroides hydrogenigenes]
MVLSLARNFFEMEGFLTFIIFLILGFYLLGFLGKLALKLYIKRMQKRFGGFENGNGAFFHNFTYGFGGNRQTSQEENHREGDVTITNSNAKQDKKIKRDTGDYVDFEEIK